MTGTKAGTDLSEGPQASKQVVFSREIHERIAALEKRDWELRMVVALILCVITAGFIVVIYPAVFWEQNVFTIPSHISGLLAVGPLVIVAVCFPYFLSKHKKVRQA